MAENNIPIAAETSKQEMRPELAFDTEKGVKLREAYDRECERRGIRPLSAEGRYLLRQMLKQDEGPPTRGQRIAEERIEYNGRGSIVIRESERSATIIPFHPDCGVGNLEMAIRGAVAALIDEALAEDEEVHRGIIHMLNEQHAKSMSMATIIATNAEREECARIAESMPHLHHSVHAAEAIRNRGRTRGQQVVARKGDSLDSNTVAAMIDSEIERAKAEQYNENRQDWTDAAVLVKRKPGQTLADAIRERLTEVAAVGLWPDLKKDPKVAAILEQQEQQIPDLYFQLLKEVADAKDYVRARPSESLKDAIIRAVAEGGAK